MKLRKLIVQNVLSYGPRTEFDFDNRFNILIGPNGGGKTNLQRIIVLALSKYFIFQYQFKRDDNGASVELFDPWATDRNLQKVFPKYVGDEGEQVIELVISSEPQDVANIRTIGNNLEAFNKELHIWEKLYDRYEPLPFADAIAASPSFHYVIRNLKLEKVEEATPQWAFLEYLREFFIFLRVAHRVPNITLASPIFFFSSERALNKSLEVQVGNLSDQVYFDTYRSAYQAAMGESMNLMQWGAQHFVRLLRKAFREASDSEQQWKAIFSTYDDVKLMARYLEQLGYGSQFRWDNDQLTFWFLLIKDGYSIPPEMFSSGEREIVHFLLALFALNARDGLILVDEPELHLHPRWQRIFLTLFRDSAADRNNQFIITTHSPSFVTPDTIDSVIRVYRTSKGSSQVALRTVDLPEKKTLVRMINSQNNERIFFADSVLLVEGVSDRIVLESMIDSAASRFNIGAAIEIVEVGGKTNFPDYSIVLEGLKTPYFIVADQDYLATFGSEAVRPLFITDSRKQWEVLTEDKHSTDRAALLAHLGTAISNGELDELRKFWEYFRNRLKHLKAPLSSDEMSALTAEYERCEREHIFVLRSGEIEDYLPAGAGDVRGIVALVSDPQWINNVQDNERRAELVRIVCTVLNLNESDRDSFFAESKAKTVSFVKKPKTDYVPKIT